MASTDATAIPVKNQAYRVTFPILDADGDLVAGATNLDSEVSKDAGTFADCTNEGDDQCHDQTGDDHSEHPGYLTLDDIYEDPAQEHTGKTPKKT